MLSTSLIEPAKLNYEHWQFPEGSLVRLTHLQEEDLELLYLWFVQSQEAQMTCKPIQNLSFEQSRQQFKDRKPCKFAVRRIADNQLVGRISCFNFNIRNRSVEIGYLTGLPYRRQGYTKQALQLLISYLFNTVKFNKVMAQTGAFNQASIALLTSLGFQQDGCLRQHHELDGKLYDDFLFSLLAEEFRIWE
ncbi:GNAT family protein [Brasilonema sp. UFV-L1]|uniref:GNAT family N-acetyltransferase n=1 Tax=Brasilonema sp. UFV-L1 TaxID=2234130 RepID=UPI00145FD1BB|nr:GNAT family protein [Brasilonema sp. UFV-L1]NMG09542.1 N-acetyltransferase [Brasilonema sp. UFV-L1]